MTYSNRGNSGFSGGSYGKRDFNDRGSERPMMFDAICAKCGTNCQVPFKPNGRKEVFCSKCFEMQGGGSRESSYGESRAPRMFDKRDGGGSNFSDRQMFSATCDQCGEHCQVPFRPTQGKPVLCSNCFAEKNGDRGSRTNVSTFTPRDNGLDLEAINMKLDKIIKLLTPEAPKEASEALTEKILEKIELTSRKKIVTGKKKAKTATKSQAE